MHPDPDQDALLERAARGDAEAMNLLFASQRPRLRRMVELRLDDRLRSRLDASDVIQEAQLEVFARLPNYLESRPMPFWLWLRLEVARHLCLAHRRHLGTAMRDVRREVPAEQAAPSVSSAALAAQLQGREDSPSEGVVRAERVARLRRALDSLDEADREVLALRHFEQLSNKETAEVLGISESAATKRYLRALDRLEIALGGTSEA